ncbi:MAG: DNA replication protein psf2 [Chaenotheca gracillima]|nr:MAG: DNA replication protein psf2 [Chaenotheca gracillima]
MDTSGVPSRQSLDQSYSMKPVGSVEYRDAGSDGMGDESIVNRDEKEMAYLGKKQELKRRFGFMSMLGFTCTLLSTWEGIFVVFLYGYDNGGPAGLIYGYIYAWLGTFAIVASIGELASMAPVAGGQYHWVAMLSPPEYYKFLSYLTGWVNVIGWQAVTASVAFLGGTILQGLLVLNYPNYVFERYHGTLLFYAVIALTLFVNTYLAKLLPKIEGIILIIHICGFFGILIPLIYLSDHQSASAVFGTFTNGGGWQTMGLSFFVGISTSVFSFLGADGACHMAEEIHNASTIVPWSMLATIGLNGVMGFAMLIAVLFCINDADAVLNSATGYPFIEIFRESAGSNAGATAMVAVVLALDIFASFGYLASSSRMMWAFARDHGLPGSKYLARVEPKTALPLWSIALTVLISLLLALINVGSTEAFNAILSLVISGFFCSYMLPITLLIIKRVKNDPMRMGPFNMGRSFGLAVNIFAMIYGAIAVFFSFWPSTLVVDAASMNWSILVFGVSVLFSVVYYFVYGHRFYTPPFVRRDHRDS